MAKVYRFLNRKPFVLVTGAAGFIAFHLIEELLRQGQPVLGIDSFDSFYPRADKERNLRDLRQMALDCGTPFDFFEQDVGDLTDESFRRYQVDSVIHLAAKPGMRPSFAAPESYLQTNVEGTLRALEFARTRGITRFLLGSSASVYGDTTPTPYREEAVADRPSSPYAASKRAAELYASTWAQVHGITVACLRFFTVYGPRQRPDLAIHQFTRRVSRGETITLFGDGFASRDYVHVTDAVTAVARAFDWTARVAAGTFEAFNVGSGQAVTLQRLVQSIEKATGRKANTEVAAEEPGAVRTASADPRKSASVLGYRPTVSFETGIREFVRWYQEEAGILPASTDLRRVA